MAESLRHSRIGLLTGSTWTALGQGVTYGENGRGFGIVLAQRNPQAEVVAVDWPGVLAVASEPSGAHGAAPRSA